MTTDATDVAMAAVLDTLILVQSQLVAIAESNVRIEAMHRDVLNRLDRLDADQGGTTSLVTMLEAIVARSAEDRERNRAGLKVIAEVAAFAHAAAMGNRAPLPIVVADDPLLERFLLNQPVDFVSTDPALVRWREAAKASATIELVDLLARQYRPSPTDTAETRVLRYQLAAITRAELQGREAAMPQIPASTVAQDRSPQARQARSVELARLWRSAEDAPVKAEPELAGAVDRWIQVVQRAGTISEELRELRINAVHQEIGDDIERGERPVPANTQLAPSNERSHLNERTHLGERTRDTQPDIER